ncbi:unnamed protein product [Ectocarpus sp. 6 AP-2014]
MNSPEITRFMRALESPYEPCPVCAKGRGHGEACVGREIQSLSLKLIPSNPNFRSLKLDMLLKHSGNLLVLDAVCYSLTANVMYRTIGVDESDMRRILSEASVYGMWMVMQRAGEKISFFNHIDETTARKVATANHALVLYARVKRIGGINYQMLEPDKLTLVQVLRHFIKCWRKSNRHTINRVCRRPASLTKELPPLSIPKNASRGRRYLFKY